MLLKDIQAIRDSCKDKSAEDMGAAEPLMHCSFPSMSKAVPGRVTPSYLSFVEIWQTSSFPDT
jgi:hypothetical protein